MARIKVLALKVYGYERVTYRPGIYEFIFADFTRPSIDGFLNDIGNIADEIKRYKVVCIRGLLDLNNVTVPTPYATAGFWSLVKRQISVPDARIAILVKETPVIALMKTYMRQYRGNSELSLFTNRDNALAWLDIESLVVRQRTAA